MIEVLRPVHITVHWLRYYGGGGAYQVGGSHGNCTDSCYLAQLVPVELTLKGHRDGDTFDPTKDEVRLNKLQLRVYHAMKDGHWRSLDMISDRVNGGYIKTNPRNWVSQPSISARLRDFRKARFGGHTVERRRTSVPGLFEYRLIWNEEVPRP